MPAHRLKELADQPARRPVDEHDGAARPADADELARDDLAARRELHAEDRGDDVEAIVGERQRLGVALDPLDREAALLGAVARHVEQLVDQVEAGHGRAGGGRLDGEVAAAGGDVEQAPARDVDRLEHGGGRRVGDVLGDGGVVAVGPRVAMLAP